MSGIAQVAALGQNPPANTLNITSVVTGDRTLNVSTGSGNSDELANFYAEATNGTPPYTYLWERRNGPGKVNLASASSQYAYVTWSGLLVGEQGVCHVSCTITDSGGRSGTSDLESISVRRG